MNLNDGGPVVKNEVADQFLPREAVRIWRMVEIYMATPAQSRQVVWIIHRPAVLDRRNVMTFGLTASTAGCTPVAIALENLFANPPPLFRVHSRVMLAHPTTPRDR